MNLVEKDNDGELSFTANKTASEIFISTIDHPKGWMYFREFSRRVYFNSVREGR